MILAIDPGNEQSAFVLYDADTRRLRDVGKLDNSEVLAKLVVTRHEVPLMPWWQADMLAIEMIASYGMPVGREVFETCVWIGRFLQAWDDAHALVYRKDVKLHLCNSPRANDATIRAALIDRFGGKDRAIGRKAAPGPLYRVKADAWSALAIAVTYSETQAKEQAA